MMWPSFVRLLCFCHVNASASPLSFFEAGLNLIQSVNWINSVSLPVSQAASQLFWVGHHFLFGCFHTSQFGNAFVCDTHSYPGVLPIPQYIKGHVGRSGSLFGESKRQNSQQCLLTVFRFQNNRQKPTNVNWPCGISENIKNICLCIKKRRTLSRRNYIKTY